MRRGVLALEDLGIAFYWSFLAVSSVLLATVAWLVARRTKQPLAALAVVFGVSMVVLVGDVMTGSNLHLSAAFGYSVGCSIAYAWLPAAAAHAGRQVEIEYFGERLPAVVAEEPLFDREMARLRS